MVGIDKRNMEELRTDPAENRDTEFLLDVKDIEMEHGEGLKGSGIIDKAPSISVEGGENLAGNPPDSSFKSELFLVGQPGSDKNDLMAMADQGVTKPLGRICHTIDVRFIRWWWVHSCPKEYRRP